jgi:membrane-bound ClpP family serine protease
MGSVTRLALFAAVLVAAVPAVAQPADGSSVEVVDVKGIIDGSVERAVAATIEEAQRNRAVLIVLQIDSEGVLGADRMERLQRTVRNSDIPISAWVGPPGAVARRDAARLVAISELPAISPLSRIEPRPSGLIRAASIPELLAAVDGRPVDGAELRIEPATASVRFHKLDLMGRILHGAAQPSITYLLLLLALVGIVFELFHPSTGPAGVAGLAALALALYGVVTLGASWLGFGLVVAGVACFAVDLRFQSLGPLTAAGLASLVAGSLLLFRGPWLRVSPWVLAIGVVGMVLFLVGAMTRVLRDLRAVARGELEVRDAHPHGGE